MQHRHWSSGVDKPSVLPGQNRGIDIDQLEDTITELMSTVADGIEEADLLDHAHQLIATALEEK